MDIFKPLRVIFHNSSYNRLLRDINESAHGRSLGFGLESEDSADLAKIEEPFRLNAFHRCGLHVAAKNSQTQTLNLEPIIAATGLTIADRAGIKSISGTASNAFRMADITQAPDIAGLSGVKRLTAVARSIGYGMTIEACNEMTKDFRDYDGATVIEAKIDFVFSSLP